jgi:alanine dehydrogenase
MSVAPLWITEAEVAALADLREAIEAVEAAFRQEAAGSARAMVKTQVGWAGGSLHAIGAVDRGAGLAGTKTWAHTSAGASPLLLLFRVDDGGLEAVVEAFALGQLRTAAVSGAATRRLARPDAEVMAICGTGEQALPQVAAVAAVRRLRQVRVWSRDALHRQALAERIRSQLGLEAEPVAAVAEAVRGAQVVTLATRASSPFLAAGMPEPGTHLNAIGAIAPDRMEFEPRLLDRCQVIAADSPEAVRSLSREFRERFGQDEAAWATVRPLSALIAGGGRPPEADLTLLKAMGVGLADLALGALVLGHARRQGAGRPLEQPRRAPIRLGPMPATNLVKGGPQS